MDEEQVFLNKLLDDPEFEAISMKLLLRDGYENLGERIEDPDEFRELVRDDILGGIIFPLLNDDFVGDMEEKDDIEKLVEIYNRIAEDMSTSEDKPVIKKDDDELKDIPNFLENRPRSKLKSPISFEDLSKLEKYNKNNKNKIKFILPDAQFNFFD